MPTGTPTLKDANAMRQQIKQLENQIKRVERREKAMADLGLWLTSRGLDSKDLHFLYKQMNKNPKKPNGAAPTPQRKNKGDTDFQKRMTAARKKRGWTPENLAKKIGVSGSTIRFWESGYSVPTEKNRKKIVHMLNLPPMSGAEATKAMIAAQIAGRAAH